MTISRSGLAPRLAAVSAAILVAAVAIMLSAAEAPAVVLESQLACQKASVKAARVYVTGTWKLLGRCKYEDLKAGASGACDSANVTDALAKAAAKFNATVTKACSLLSDTEMSDPRPAGLALAPLATALPALRSEYLRLADGLADWLFVAPATPGSPLDDDALDCVTSLSRAATKHLATAFREIGSKCYARDDAGKTGSGEVTRILEACRETAALSLDAAAAKATQKILETCDDTDIAQLGACPDDAVERQADTVADCVLARTAAAGAASLGTAHGRELPRVIGRVDAHVPGADVTIPAAGIQIQLRDAYGNAVASGNTDAQGRVDVTVPALSLVTLCWQRAGLQSCSTDPIDVGTDTVFFGDRQLEIPLNAGEIAVTGSLKLASGGPCFDAQTMPELAVQGGVRVGPTGGIPSNDRAPVTAAGDFVVAVPSAGATSLFADCGAEQVLFDLGVPPDPLTPVVIQTTNDAPTGGAIAMTTTDGTPITDPSTVSPGDTVLLHASFTDSDSLEYRWEVTRGNGKLNALGQPVFDERRASGPDVEWEIGAESGIHQVSLWAGDARGGIESLVAVLGPIGPGPVLPPPCLEPPKLQKLLCGTGYDASTPTPAGGLSNFLTYKYRNSTYNNPSDACLYYNVVDPECIDMNCDGVVDPGTDPTGKCKRTTLGGWWQKNGFNTVTGLGSDVVSAWYLNSNDLGFGREMHCRVTSWSSIISERPAAATTSIQRLSEALRSDILASPTITQWTKLFGMYPSTVACYVVNYTTDHCFNYPTNDPQNANLAYQGQQTFVANPSVDPLNAYGTVAMEFGPVEGFGELGQITKFFVYDGHTAAGKRLTSANLDGCGPKSVPGLCLSCHGGGWPGSYSQGTTLDNILGGLTSPGLVLAGIDANDTASTDAGFLLRRSILAELTRNKSGFSSFLPFDPDTFVFPAAAPLASQAAALRSLNRIVTYAQPVTPIRDLVYGWYSNNLTGGTFAPWRPAAWNDDGGQPGDESDLHDEVYAKACRVCHAAHYNFSSYSNFPGSYRICKNGSGMAGGSPTMPHAKLTYLNLWKSDFPQALTMPTLEAWYTASEGGFTSCD